MLQVGDHPFIEHESYVDYRLMRIEPATHVEARVKDGVFIAREPCSSELMRRIVAGALQSRKIPREYKKLLERVIFSG